MRTLLGVVLLASLTGCRSIGGGGFGATQGGIQDMGLARDLIASGVVPPAEAFVVEGMFSEHDLDLAGAPCATVLCLQGATTQAPDATGAERGWLQIGMSSSIDPNAYVRPSQTIVAVVDVSGSMAWEDEEPTAESATPGQLARHLLALIADDLGPDDRVAIVTFGTTTRTALDFVPGDSARLDNAIAELSEDGSTNMEQGLEKGYDLARDADFGTDEVRVMLFTDVQPNVGATGATDFERIASEGAADGIGLTAFAIGSGMSQDVLTGMAHLRGGNAFSLFDLADADALMEDSWPWMLSPIAYDLRARVSPGEGFAVGDAFGFPAPATPDAEPELEVSTVFLSRRRGAMLLELQPGVGVDVETLAVSGTLAYETPAGEPVSQDFHAGYDGPNHGVERTLALALLVDGMGEAAALYATDPVAAATAMEVVDARFTADATALADADLTVEVDLSHALLTLMQDGAPQQSPYGY